MVEISSLEPETVLVGEYNAASSIDREKLLMEHDVAIQDRQLGFSFIPFQEHNPQAIHVIADAISNIGYIGKPYHRNSQFPPDGNISTDFFDDLHNYGGIYSGILTIWDIDSKSTRDGLFPYEKQIKPGFTVSEAQFLQLQRMLENNSATEKLWGFESLKRHVSLGLKGYELERSDGTQYQTHVLLPPEKLIAIVEIPVAKREIFHDFDARWRDTLLSNPAETIESIAPELEKLLSEGVTFNVLRNLSISDLSKRILTSTYFSHLRYIAKCASYYGQDTEYGRAFGKIKPLDELSSRYIRMVNNILSKNRNIDSSI